MVAQMIRKKKVMFSTAAFPICETRPHSDHQVGNRRFRATRESAITSRSPLSLRPRHENVSRNQRGGASLIRFEARPRGLELSLIHI